MLFVLPYNRIVASKFGHTIAFESNVPTHVPPIPGLIDLVQSFGAQEYVEDTTLAGKGRAKAPVGE